MPVTGDGNSTLSPQELRRFRRFEFFGTNTDRTRKGGVGSSISRLLNPKREYDKYKRKRRGGKKNKRIYFGAFSRFRERNLDSGLFINKDHEPTLKGTAVIGRWIKIQDGKIVSGVGGNQTPGSDTQPSRHFQMTWDQTHPGPPYVGGGPFKSIVYHLPSSKKMAYGTYTDQGRSNNPNVFWQYQGSFVDDGFWIGQSYDSIRGTGFANFPSLSQYDSQAWDKLKPTIPKANLGQFIYELKDLPGQLKTSAELFRREWVSVAGSSIMVPIMRPREAADHFLNHNFGWVPFISDIQKILDAWNNSVAYIAAIVRDNGVWMKRRRALEESETVSSIGNGIGSGTIPSSETRNPDGFRMTRPDPVSGFGGSIVFTKVTKHRVWACGSFKYYRPEFDIKTFEGSSFEQLYALQRLISLYGANITPTLLYKITPWTWLIDWFTGLGNYLQRLDDFVQDGIVSRGLYIMETQEQVMTKTCVLNYYSGPVTLNFQRMLTLKQRKLADSPYGFNAPWTSLSPRQWAILGAIGISRSSSGYVSRGA